MAHNGKRPSASVAGNIKSNSRHIFRLLELFLVSSLLAVFLLPAVFGRSRDQLEQPTSETTKHPHGSEDDQDVIELESGKPIKRRLADGQEHTYQVKLSTDQFLKAIIEQQGIDVAIRVLDPNGEQTFEFDSEPRLQGTEEVSLSANAAGEYRLIVRSKYKGVPPGGYEIRIEELRAATERDRDLQEARRLDGEAVRAREARKFEEALPLVEHALEIRQKQLGPDHREVASTIITLGLLYSDRGEYAKAEPLYQRALEIQEKALGKDHPEIAQSLNNLAELYASQSKYVEAELLYKRALAINEKALGNDHPNTAQSLNNLAELYVEQGKYGEAEPLHQRALHIREKALGKDHPKTAESLNNLAGLYLNQGRYVEAEPLYKRVLDINEKALGKDHPNTAQSLNNLALLYETQGRYGEAEPLYKRSLAINERVRGADHPETATSLNNLAVLYLNQGRYVEAEPLFKRALAINERVRGEDHPETAIGLNNLAELYERQGKYEEVEPLLKRALAINERVRGADHPETATSLNNLAAVYVKQRKYEEAEPLFKRALEIREKALGKDHPDTSYSLNGLAQLYQNQGRYAEAEPLYQRALGIREKALGKDHPDTSYSLNKLAGLYEAQGRYGEAEPLYKRSLDINEKALGKDNPETAISLGDLAFLYEEQGKYLEAESLFKRALAINEKMRGKDHPEIATSLNNLAAVYAKQGKYVEAEPLYQRALAIKEKALDKDDPSIALSLNNLALLYQKQERYAEAEPLHQRALAIDEKALGKDHPDTSYSLDGLALLYQNQGRYAEAEPLYQHALEIREKGLGKDHPATSYSLNNLAGLYEAQGRYGEAEPLSRRALAIREKTLGPQHPDVAVSLSSLALISAAQGDLVQAVAFQSRANAISEHNLALNLAAGSERQKLAYLALSSDQTDFTLSLHSRYAPADPQALDLAFTTLLRRKGRGLDAMIDTIAALRRHSTSDAQKLFDQLAQARSQLAALTLRESAHAQPDTYRTRLKPLEEKVENLEAELSASSAEFRAQSQPVTISAVQAALPPDGALIEFTLFTPRDLKTGKGQSPRYLAYVLPAQGTPKWADLGEAIPIDRAIKEWRKALRELQGVKELGRELDEKVMRPVRALLQSNLSQTRRLLIAPDGSLNLIPFAALVDEHEHYLLESYTISYLTSGRDLLRLRNPEPSRNPPLLVANPFFGRPTIENSRPRAHRKDDSTKILFQPLPETEEEALAIKYLLPGATVLLGNNATESALKHVKSPSILHIATHGFFLGSETETTVEEPLAAISEDPRRISDLRMDQWSAHIKNPLLRSGLALAGANLSRNGDDDGVLTALEAAGLDLWGTKLVVLSACSTGVGEIKNGEGVQGLRRALVLAGSESQVMSLWPVSDIGTKVAMIRYYRALRRGEGRGEGLRQVQLQMLRSKWWKHPFYWAAFIQSGAWTNLDQRGPSLPIP